MKTRYLTDGKASVLLIIALVFSYGFICMTKNCFSSAMVFIVNEGLLTKFQTGNITAAFYVVYGILQIAGGILVDKWHPERFITLGMSGAAVANLLVFINQNYVFMMVVWCFNAAVQFAVWPATFKLITTMLKAEHRDKALVIITFANPLGVVASYLVAAIVPRWQVNFLVSSVGLLLIAIAWELVLRSIKRQLTEEEIDLTVKVKAEKKGSFILLFLTSGTAIFVVIAFIRTMFDLGIKSLTPTMIYKCYEGISPSFATVLNIVVLLAGALGPIIANFVYPRFVKNEAVMVAIVFSVSVPICLVTLMIGEVNYWLLVAALALLVLFMSAGSLFTTSFVSKKWEKWGKGATVVGIINCASSLGIVAANSLLTGLADSIGWGGTVRVWCVMMGITWCLTFITVPLWTKFIRKAYN